MHGKRDFSLLCLRGRRKGTEAVAFGLVREARKDAFEIVSKSRHSETVATLSNITANSIPHPLSSETFAKCFRLLEKLGKLLKLNWKSN